MFQQLEALQQHNQTLILEISSATKVAAAPKKPYTKFPTWDGKTSSVPVFLIKVESYGADPYFKDVVDWKVTTPATQLHSLKIKNDLFTSLSEDRLYKYMTNVTYTNKGIEMLADLLEQVDSTTPENRLLTVQCLADFPQLPGETTAKYLQRARWIAGRLPKLSLTDLMPLFVINGMDQELYRGSMGRCTSGDMTLTGADLPRLETILTNEVPPAIELNSNAGDILRHEGGSRTQETVHQVHNLGFQDFHRASLPRQGGELPGRPVL